MTAVVGRGPAEPKLQVFNGLLRAHIEREGQATPEQRLLIAVMEDAISRLQQLAKLNLRPAPGTTYARMIDTRQRRYYEDAVAWFYDPTEALVTTYRDREGKQRWGYHFIGVCEVLGLEPSAVRKACRRRKWLPAVEVGHETGSGAVESRDCGGRGAAGLGG
jgi:hypothetical protein